MLHPKLSVIFVTENDYAPKNIHFNDIVKALLNSPIIQDFVVISDSPQKPHALGERLRYAHNFAAALSLAHGEYICFVAELSPNLLEVVSSLYEYREQGTVIVGKRTKDQKFAKKETKKHQLLRKLVARLLSIPIQDIFSPYLLLERSILASINPSEVDRGLLIELLTRALIQGYQVSERDIPTPYSYPQPRQKHIGTINLTLLYKLWVIRNSIESADYDHRAHYSIIPPQRYWQRRRYKYILDFLGEDRRNTLDIGCGSSNIIQSLPDGIALDIAMNKLRFLRQTNKYRVLASTFALPFEANSFRHIIHSQVIEHVPENRELFYEVDRVLKPGGTLIIGTPDYGRIWWPIIEFLYAKLLPNAYADEHITHYTREKLLGYIEPMGYTLVSYKYILGGELIMKFIKEQKNG